jgi:hypothetical protein
MKKQVAVFLPKDDSALLSHATFRITMCLIKDEGRGKLSLVEEHDETSLDIDYIVIPKCLSKKTFILSSMSM